MRAGINVLIVDVSLAVALVLTVRPFQGGFTMSLERLRSFNVATCFSRRKKYQLRP
jgi:hypothetical protein